MMLSQFLCEGGLGPAGGVGASGQGSLLKLQLQQGCPSWGSCRSAFQGLASTSPLLLSSGDYLAPLLPCTLPPISTLCPSGPEVQRNCRASAFSAAIPAQIKMEQLPREAE